jgi:hypothetical protein
MAIKKYTQKPKIVVSPTTKKQLDSLKLINEEKYDSVIIRLIEAKRK